MNLRKLGLYWHTLKYLRPVQFTGRVKFRLARPTPDTSPAPALRAASGTWQRPASREASMTGIGKFLFLDEPGSLAANGWDDPAKSKLWRYNQHYFDDLNAQDAADRREWHTDLITRWITANAPGLGSGWEPYPTSLRLVNWIKFACSGGELLEQAHHSLAVQARWLTRRLEWHLLGNHLFANAKALMHAGLFFEGPEADEWRATAGSILAREVPEQILPDGGHFELSPMYHALALEDVLDLVNILTTYADALSEGERSLLEDLRKRYAGMRDWLAAMSHPDGQITFFNDAAFGIAPESTELDDLAGRLGLEVSHMATGLRHLPDSGFARLAKGPAVVIADLAPIGPDYLPGHAHADTLSFEASVHGQRLFVNSGISEYGTGSERARQRGTLAHNTVTVEGANSSEVWAGFRVARRARVHDVDLTDEGDTQRAEARHDGYHRLSPGLDHHRRWEMKNKDLKVTDSLSKDRPAVARYHLHPDVQCKVTGGSAGEFQMPNGETLSWHAAAADVSLEDTTWHPRFGASQPNTCLVLTLDKGQAALTVGWG